MTERRTPKPKTRTWQNGKKPLFDYTVTFTYEDFMNLRAHNKEDAEQRAIKEIRRRWGAGRNLQAIKAERLST